MLNAREIKELRGRLKLTQKELAAKVKVAPQTVKQWEQGTQRPSQLAERQLARLARK